MTSKKVLEAIKILEIIGRDSLYYWLKVIVKLDRLSEAEAGYLAWYFKL